MAISRSGPASAIRLELELSGDDRIDVALSRFGESVEDFRDFWTSTLAPRFFDEIQRNFDLEGKLVGGWAPLSPAYREWKRAHYPGRRILERTLRLRQSLTWNAGRFSLGGGRGNLGRDGIFRPTPTDVEMGTSVPYASFHQDGAPARQRGLDARGRLRSRRTGRFVARTRTGRSVVSGRFLGGLPQRKFLFLRSATTYGRWLHTWLIDRLDKSGLRTNAFGVDAGVA
jgi:phage gpG-like protein